MRTNSSGVTENAFANIDLAKYQDNYVHIFQKDKCECEECGEMRKDSSYKKLADDVFRNIDADIIK